MIELYFRDVMVNKMDDAIKSKKILLISHNFPPATTPRSVRWKQIIKYLSRRGYYFDVLTIKRKGDYRLIHKEIFGSLAEKINVIHTYPGPFNAIYNPIHISHKSKQGKFGRVSLVKRIFQRAFNSIMIPDTCIEWLPWGIRELKRLKLNQYCAVISSAQPYTAHILASYFKKWTGTPWIADYGDPWGFNPFLSRWRLGAGRFIENRLLKKVDQIVVTTEETKKGFTDYYPFIKESMVSVITQGFDSEKYDCRLLNKEEKLKIVYTGIFYKGFREPYAFFEAIEELGALNLEVILAGEINKNYTQWVTQRKLDKRITFLERQSHDNSISLQKDADVLLLVGNAGQYQLPGKIFEYMGACRPILHIKNDDRDIASTYIQKYHRGLIVSNEKNSIKGGIEKLYKLKVNSCIEQEFSLKPLKEFSWEQLSLKWDKCLESII